MTWFESQNIRSVCIIALLIRLGVTYLGVFIDNSSYALRYTDIDYAVFSDGAKLILSGSSPYDRATYRYSPILAIALLPVQFFPQFGKLVFSAADVVCIYIVYSILKLKSKSSEVSLKQDFYWSFLMTPKYAAWMWALNPFMINLCTRGSSDSITNCMILFVVQQLLQRKYRLSGLVFGMLVHLRIYPVIYSVSFLFFIMFNNSNHHAVSDSFNIRHALNFCVYATVGLLTLSWLSFSFFGMDYLVHAVWYHIVRSDHRHNFSIHFYSTYLTLSEPSIASETVAALNADIISTIAHKAIFFVPQFFIILLISAIFASGNLPVSLFLQTLVFVTYNKVITAQYFSWYACFIPIIAPEIASCVHNWPGSRFVLLLGGLLWVSGLALWLLQGYNLEFLGHDSFRGIWLASIFFFLVNVSWIIGLILLLPLRLPQTVEEADIHPVVVKGSKLW